MVASPKPRQFIPAYEIWSLNSAKTWVKRNVLGTVIISATQKAHLDKVIATHNKMRSGVKWRISRAWLIRIDQAYYRLYTHSSKVVQLHKLIDDDRLHEEARKKLQDFYSDYNPEIVDEALTASVLPSEKIKGDLMSYLNRIELEDNVHGANET